MRRTTICPSRVVHLAALGLAGCLVAAPLAAQQPQQPPPQPAGQQPAARTGPTTSPPATHVVARGETLWALAQQYLGDPLLWPEIYRLNTTVVEDPHWIFPGEERRLAPGAEAMAAAPSGQAGAAPGAGAAAPGAITVAPAAADTARTAPERPSAGFAPLQGPTIFSGAGPTGRSGAELQIRTRQAYRAVRMGEHFSAGFLADQDTLNPGRVLGNVQTSSIERLTTSSAPQLYNDVAIEPPPGDSVKPGDLLMSYDVPRDIVGYGSVIRPTGLLRVTGTGESGQSVAEVVAVYQAIHSGQGLLKAQPFQSAAGARPTPVSDGVVGSVIDLRDKHELAEAQDVLFIDRGSEEGVRPGDVFEISNLTDPSSDIGAVVQEAAKVLIVNTQPHTSSGIIIELDRPDIRPGATARQILKMES